jgi:ferritin
MPTTEFIDELNEQLGESFAASQQYLAMGVFFRRELMPRVGAVFYDRAVDERNRAIAMMEYLLGAGAEAVIPGVASPQTSFAGVVEPLDVAIERERRLVDRAGGLVRIAKESGDFGSEQFMKRLIGDQAQRVSTLLSLRNVVRRCTCDPQQAEVYLASGHTPAPRDGEGARFARLAGAVA